jgi:hypothetical protein
MYSIVKSNTDIRMVEYSSIRIIYAGPIRVWIIEYSNTRIIPITDTYINSTPPGVILYFENICTLDNGKI